MTVVIPYASSGPKKANLNEIVFAEGDLTMMTANYSTSMWVKHKVNYSTSMWVKHKVNYSTSMCVKHKVKYNTCMWIKHKVNISTSM